MPQMFLRQGLLIIAVTVSWQVTAVADDQIATTDSSRLPDVGDVIAAKDSLLSGTDAVEDARQCLAGLCWEPREFSITVEVPDEDRGDRVIRFPSPVVGGGAAESQVAMEWYAARDSDGQLVRAPAIVVVHESGSGMTVGRLLARGFHAQQLHAFLIHLPGYGRRRGDRVDRPDAVLVQMKQGIADVRRARDAVAALPLVASDRIGLQGTSLGGFVAATVAGLDDGYQRVFIVLAGGNLHDVILSGNRDAAKVRQKLEAAGLDDQAIRGLTHPVEPLRLAHRIRPDITWLYSGLYDDVVPPECSLALAAAGRLPDDHHIRLPADHYSGIVFLPTIITDISDRMKER